MSWSEHVANVCKSSASKPRLLRRTWFLPQMQLLDFHMKVILPSVTYGLVVLGIVQRDTLQQPGKLHAKARGIVYGLPWNTSAEDVIAPTQCTVLKHYSKYNWRSSFLNAIKAIPSHNARMYLYRGIQAAKTEEMMIPSFQEQKEISLGTPNSTKEQ